MNYIIEFFWFFIIYAFLGWCLEIIYHVVKVGNFSNRGFLNGPICPIYGFGMLTLIYFLEPIKDNIFILFIGTVILTTFLEFITGFVLEKVFNNKWWDYSDMPFNIKGYICVAFSLLWGLAGVFMISIIHKPISIIVQLLNNVIGNTILIILIIYLAIDFLITVLGIIKIKKNLYILELIASRLREYSDDIGGSLYKGTNIAIKKKEIIIHKLSEKNFTVEELKERYEKIIKEKGFVHRRIEKAFPNIKEKIYKKR